MIGIHAQRGARAASLSGRHLRWLSPTPACRALEAPEDPPPSKALVAVSSNRGVLATLGDVVADAVHTLVVLATRLRHVGANEEYVWRTLRRQGLDDWQLDLLLQQHPQVFRLSVRHDIEPVVAFLRSQGLAGSALAEVLCACPAALGRPVEDHVMPLCAFLRGLLGSRSMGALLRHPPLLDAAPPALRAALAALLDAGAGRAAAAALLWDHPRLFLGLAQALHQLDGGGGGGGGATGGRARSVWSLYGAGLRAEAASRELPPGDNGSEAGVAEAELMGQLRAAMSELSAAEEGGPLHDTAVARLAAAVAAAEGGRGAGEARRRP